MNIRISLTNWVGCGRIKPHLKAALCRMEIKIHRTKEVEYEKDKNHLHHWPCQRK